MAASIASALKQLIEGAGLGLAAYRDRVPTGNAGALPFVTITEGVALGPEEAFSAFDDDEQHVREEVQVDLWQRWRDADGVPQEDFALPDALVSVLHGKGLATAPMHVSGMRVTSVIRQIEADASLIHHAITVEVARVLQRS